MKKTYSIITVLLLGIFAAINAGETPGKGDIVAADAKVKKIGGGFRFTEGPASDGKGNVYFTDVPSSRIYKITPDGKVAIYMDNTQKCNGLYFDAKGNLIACQGGAGKLISIDSNKKITVLADKYDGKDFNSPNDLWIDPNGGVYFTDPRYGRRDNLPQDGEHVYYLSPDGKKVTRVINDMVRPNGLIGTPDGKYLYVADEGGKKTFRYTIGPDGQLTDKKLFASQGSDGMTIDDRGNVYLTDKAVSVYDPAGNKIKTIRIPEVPANVCFGGKDNATLFITARNSVYSLPMQVKGAK